MIIVSIQFICDGGCSRTKIWTGKPETSADGMNSFLEAGWEKRGRKCYCPECANAYIDENQAKQIP